MKNLPGPIKRSLYLGLYYCPVGFAVGLYVNISAIGDYSSFQYYSTLAAFIGTALFWGIFVEWKSNYNRIDYGIAGGVGAIVSHHICFYLMVLVSNFQYHILGMQINSLNGTPINPLSAVWLLLPYTFYSLVFYGWITIPAGILIGVILGGFHTKKIIAT